MTVERPPELVDEVEEHRRSGRSCAYNTIFAFSVACFIYVVFFLPTGAPAETFPSTFNPEPVSEGIPSKFALPYDVPRYYQEDRGTCWDFATLGMLQYSYRKQGIENGWLSDHHYLPLSEQAYGISMVSACKNKPLVCSVLGDGVLQNSTDGGEISWLYYLQEHLRDQVLPLNVCPYPKESGHDLECPGMDEALAANPLLFSVGELTTVYSINDAKSLLVEKQRSLGWSQPVPDVYWYLPCEGAWENQPECSAESSVACPAHFRASRCAAILTASYNMNGEYCTGDAMVAGGGHAENLVGFNDEYVDQYGNKGAFIIRNSWHDQVYPEPRGPRGSHSIDFLMHRISDWDERSVCPNAYNPRNWLSCVNIPEGPTGGSRRKAAATLDNPLATCLDKVAMDKIVKNTFQPTEFVCTNKAMCDPSKRYFLLSRAPGVTPSSQMYSFAEVAREASNEGLFERVEEEIEKLRGRAPAPAPYKTVTLPPMPEDLVAEYFQPTPEQAAQLPDDKHHCGYYTVPYAVLTAYVRQFGSWFVTDMDITWEPQSYAANAAEWPQFNYTLVRASLSTQSNIVFGGPQPFDKRWD